MEGRKGKNSIYLRYNKKVVKPVWEASCEYQHDDEDEDDEGDEFYCDEMMMMAWPPRSYTCSFCKREFRSAQALGGHMNVHRRDRAQLRQLSQITLNSPPSFTANPHPSLNLNLPPNPNEMIYPPNYPPRTLLMRPSSPDLITKKQFEFFRKRNNLCAAISCPQAFKKFAFKPQDDHVGLTKGEEIIRLNLEMNINVGDCVLGEDLDLELRLGCK